MDLFIAKSLFEPSTKTGSPPEEAILSELEGEELASLALEVFRPSHPH